MVVGLIVEPPLDTVEGSSGGVSSGGSGDGADFVVNDLRFQVSPNNKTPYERATAQFKKDQYDTGREAGDQSLTGWWTRGEFSFHKGAGITYYEVSEGDTILNRYSDSEGVDPFDPGKVTCQRAWTTGITSLGSVSKVRAIGSYMLALDGTSLKYSNGFGFGSTYTPAGGATVRAFTVSPSLAYAVLSNGKIASFNPSGAVETTLYTGLTTTARSIWYVKGRLLVSDSDGKWYQLSATPTGTPAVASTDVMFTASDWDANSALTDTPGPILVSNSNRIFALTLDSTGTLPAIAAPIQVAELPPGEIISSMTFHLGFVVLWTSAGIRVGVVADSGQVTYGPVLIEHATPVSSFYNTTMARYGTRVAAQLEGRIYEIDLSEQIGNGLEFAYAGRGTPLGSASNGGVLTSQYTTLVAWNATSVYSSASTANLMEGSLTTGLHRFNVLDPKRFDSVRLVASGTAGTITVYRVDSDGTQTSLYSMAVANNKVLEISLRMTSAAESVGLKFVLTPDATTPTLGPTLLGYQLRALPEPKRQRLIRVPLLLNDVERRQPGRAAGSLGSAWSRLSALEDLESTQSIVTFSDLRTGETGRAYIESVEFTNVTPPTANSKGFGGGVLFLTLRKLP